MADTHQAGPPPSAWSPLAVPAFRTVWTATLVANIGAWVASVGTGWLMTTLDPSPIWVSLVGAATALPMFLFALPAARSPHKDLCGDEKLAARRRDRTRGVASSCLLRA